MIFWDYYLPHEDCDMLKMDTGSRLPWNFCRKHRGRNETRIKEPEKHNWFITPLASQGKRTPGLFKVEFEGDKIIDIYIKSYCTEPLPLKVHPPKSSSA